MPALAIPDPSEYVESPGVRQNAFEFFTAADGSEILFSMKQIANSKLAAAHGLLAVSVFSSPRIGGERPPSERIIADNRTAITIKQVLVADLSRRSSDPFPVLDCNFRVDAGGAAVETILSQRQIPIVIFWGSDPMARGAMNAFEQAKVRVVSVIGIDDIAFSFLARPPLATIRVPGEQRGKIAFQALNKMLKLKPLHQERSLGLAVDIDQRFVQKYERPTLRGRFGKSKWNLNE